VLGAALSVGIYGAIAAALFWWGRWVARRHGTAGWRWLSWLPVVGFVFNLVVTLAFGPTITVLLSGMPTGGGVLAGSLADLWSEGGAVAACRASSCLCWPRSSLWARR